jgi:hypothetical protein
VIDDLTWDFMNGVVEAVANIALFILTPVVGFRNRSGEGNKYCSKRREILQGGAIKNRLMTVGVFYPRLPPPCV